MNITEIINRPIEQANDQNEMEFVISEYIFRRKGQRVNVIGIDPMQFDMFGSLIKFQDAFFIACKWLKENEITGKR